MHIKKIEIQNVKGIDDLVISQPIFANRPNILVAPNGFGKSSIATAFSSLNTHGIEIKDDEVRNGDKALLPKLIVTTCEGKEEDFIATTTENTINKKFDIYVVNCQLRPSAKPQRFGKVVTAKASLNIAPTIIYKTIPPKVSFEYSYAKMKRIFGTNGKILNDISTFLDNSLAIESIEKKVDLKHFESKKFAKQLTSVVGAINSIASGTTIEIKNEINRRQCYLVNDEQFCKLGGIILQYNSEMDSLSVFCTTWQYITIHQSMKSDFRKAQKYLQYKHRKRELDLTLENLNPVKNRFKIVSKESKNQLVIEWPKANQISNGQRDILVFVSKLIECEFQAGENCILIIDEFFDYLDDANVVAFQYYVSTLIEKFKKRKQIIFPILLTHLDPNYLKHFCFNDKKMNVCYLTESMAKITNEIKKLIVHREDETVKDILDTYYFHYHNNIEECDFTQKFENLSLNKDWGRPSAFKKKVSRIFRTYLLESDKQYDPLAVCIFIRTFIEEKVYNDLKNDDEKRVFLSTHATSEKLNYAQEHGVILSELYFLLGIIYNHPLHLTDNDDDISKPLGMKLDNSTIKSMIRNLFDSNQNR